MTQIDKTEISVGRQGPSSISNEAKPEEIFFFKCQQNIILMSPMVVLHNKCQNQPPENTETSIATYKQLKKYFRPTGFEPVT